MQIIKDNLRLILLSVITGISISFSTLNYSSGSETPAEKSTAELLRECYLDLWYWMEGMSLAQFILALERYGDRPLAKNDLERIHHLSFIASHALAPYFFHLRRGFYSAAYQQGKPFDDTWSPEPFHQSPKEFLDWYYKLHKRISPYHSTNDLGKNIKQVFEESYRSTYQEYYERFKQRLAHYSPSSKPHIAGLGEKRAWQWLRYEITDALYTQAKYHLKGLRGLFNQRKSDEFQPANTPEINQILFGPDLYRLQHILEGYVRRPLVKQLLPDLHKKMLDIIEASADDHFDVAEKAAHFLKDLLHERQSNQPPYGIASTSMAFSSLPKLRNQNLNLHVISALSLTDLKTLRRAVAQYLKEIGTLLTTPANLVRWLGISPQ